MDTGFVVLIAPLMCGAMCWQMSALHIETWLAANDPDHEPPGVLAKMFLGKLFTTLPLLGRYTELREAQELAPVGVYGFWGGLAVTLIGLVVFIASLSSL
ncbi:MAG: hypothetical protein R3F61_29615 [Myxococcota bacterium]